jgi:hypothetical protein
MKPTRKISRRSFLTRVAGGAIAGGAALTILGESAEAGQVSDRDPTDAAGRGYTGVTDNDSGSNADRAGHGRGRRRTGITDNDRGAGADAAGYGRGRRRSGITDNDTGRNADPAGNGRGRRNCSDSDSGTYADPAGRGRRC